ncbi:unnamed protein product, partial [Closterium sp. NIES-53]
ATAATATAIANAATAAAIATPACCASMASLRVLPFDHEGRPIEFDTWLDDLQLYQMSDSKDSVSLFDHVSGAATAPPATADSATRLQWLTRDAATRLAIRNHLPLAECAHFGQHRTAQALYDAVVARYSSPATAALGRLLLPYLFPELSAFATVDDLVSHPRTSDARYRATVPAEDHFLSLDTTSLTIDLLEEYLLAAETRPVAVGAARGTPRPPFFEGCSPTPLAPSYTLAAAADVPGAEDIGAASASAKRRSGKGKGSTGGGGGSGSGTGGSSGGGGGSGGGRSGGSGGGSGGAGGGGGGSGGCGGRGGGGTGGGRTGAWRGGSGGGQRQQQQRPSSFTCGRLHTQHHYFSRLDDAWRAEFGDEVERPLWADLLRSGGLEVSKRSGVAIFDLEFDVIISAMYALSASAEGDCYYTAALQDVMVTTTTPGGQHVSICTCTRTRRHLATFTRRLGSSLYTLATEPPQTLLWHHHLGHPFLPRLRGMHSHLLVSGLPRSLPPLPPSPAPPCLPCIEGQQRAAPHSSSFPPTTASLQTLYMDVWGPARVSGQDRERYFLLVVDDYTRYTTVFPFRSKVLLQPGGAEIGGAEPRGVEPAGAESGGAELGDAEPVGVESGGAEPRGTPTSGGAIGVSPGLEPLSPQQLREWLSRRARLRSGASGAGDSAAGDAGAGGATGAGVSAGGTAGVEAGGAGAGTAGGTGDAGAGGTTDVGARGAGPAGAGADSGDPGRSIPYFVTLLQQVLGLPSSTDLSPPFLCPLPDQSQPRLQSAAPLPAPAPYTEQTGGLAEHRDPESRPALPVCTGRHVPRPRPPPVPGTHAMVLRPSSISFRVPLPTPPKSSLPAVPDPESDCARTASPTVSQLLDTVVTDTSFESSAASALVAVLVDFAAACRLDYATALVAETDSAGPPSVGGECALGTDVLEDRQEDFECLAAAVPRFASMLLAPEGDPDAPDIPTPRSYAEAITGPYSSQWQATMDAEMASWKSTGTYVDAVPPSRANIVDGMWIFRVKRPPSFPPAFKARYVARGFTQRLGVDYFQTFSPTPKMTTLRELLHVAAQCDYELHSLDFSTTFLQGSLHEEIWPRRPPGFTGSFPAGTQWSLQRPVYGLRQAPREWHDTLRTTLAALGFTPSTAAPSLSLCAESSLPPFYVLVYVLQRFGFQFSSPQSTPLSTSHSLSAPPSDESVEPSGPYPELVGCLISSCEAEIYAGAMAAQDLRWLTYLLTDLGEQPRSSPVLYQRGQLRLAYVATWANTADIFTKALPPGDHQLLTS